MPLDDRIVYPTRLYVNNMLIPQRMLCKITMGAPAVETKSVVLGADSFEPVHVIDYTGVLSQVVVYTHNYVYLVAAVHLWATSVEYIGKNVAYAIADNTGVSWQFKKLAIQEPPEIDGASTEYEFTMKGQRVKVKN